MGCLQCGDTGILISGAPCPACKEKFKKINIVPYGVPAQYQGVVFDKSFLPEKEQGTYGVFMEELYDKIISDYAFFQKNILICSRPNSGKTVWAYNIYSKLAERGYEIPPLRDIMEVKNALNNFNEKSENALFSNARCAIIKIPLDLQPWLFDSISTIVERRVRNNGFTIFLYGGSLEDLKASDRYGRLRNILGNGSYNTIKVESFIKEVKYE